MEPEQKKTCFVIMPISDVEGYEEGHFKRVYEYIIKPACTEAGFIPVRADDIKKTNVIVIDILQRLLNSDMAICDLSAKNPNVLYELGIRQAFNLPVSFIKDDITSRIFDIQGFRDVEYRSSLRVDEVSKAIEAVSASLIDTYESKGTDVNSIIELLGITSAKIPDKVEISPETDILLKSIHDISSRLGTIEGSLIKRPAKANYFKPSIGETDVESYILDGIEFKVGDLVKHGTFGIGTILQALIDNRDQRVKVVVNFPQGIKQLLANYAKLTRVDEPEF